MFKAIRISILLLVLFFVVVSMLLTQARSTDWNNSLWVKVYPINGDGSDESAKYIESLTVKDFAGIESFLERETKRYAHSVSNPVRIELGEPIGEQPPELGQDPNVFSTGIWSLKLRWWASRITDDQDRIDPDVQIFVRYHKSDVDVLLDNSLAMRKAMVGIVNARASRRHRGENNVVIAHEFLHTLGATDKYNMLNGHPIGPDGLAEPERKPLFPQRYAEIMGGRIALAADHSVKPKSLKHAVIGPLTASEINLID